MTSRRTRRLSGVAGGRPRSPPPVSASTAAARRGASPTRPDAWTSSCCRSTTSTATSSRRAAPAAGSSPATPRLGPATGTPVDATTATPVASSTSPPTSSRRAPGHPTPSTVAAGDIVGASPLLSAAFHDEPTIEAMNALGLDVTSVGNHEFDEGYKELQRLARTAAASTTATARTTRTPAPDGKRFTGAELPIPRRQRASTGGTGKTILPPYCDQERSTAPRSASSA